MVSVPVTVGAVALLIAYMTLASVYSASYRTLRDRALRWPEDQFGSRVAAGPVAVSVDHPAAHAHLAVTGLSVWTPDAQRHAPWSCDSEMGTAALGARLGARAGGGTLLRPAHARTARGEARDDGITYPARGWGIATRSRANALLAGHASALALEAFRDPQVPRAGVALAKRSGSAVRVSGDADGRLFVGGLRAHGKSLRVGAPKRADRDACAQMDDAGQSSLCVDGEMSYSSRVSMSDARLKTNVSTLRGDRFPTPAGVSYTWRASGLRRRGFIAQDSLRGGLRVDEMEALAVLVARAQRLILRTGPPAR